MRLRNVVLILAALTVVVMLAACSSSGQSSDEGGKDQAGKVASGEQAQKQKPPEKEPPKLTKEAKGKQIAPKKGKAQGQRKVANSLDPPKDKTLKLTIPEMKQIEDDTIPTGKGTNEALFHDHAAVHLRDTGFPWQKTANVYIAGHRIGFPGTDSNLAFYDLEDLKKGDKIYLEDAEGREYTYQVFGKLVVAPGNLSVLRPIKGKNIVSLQTCTLPDYTNRVIYRAVLKDVRRKPRTKADTERRTHNKRRSSAPRRCGATWSVTPTPSFGTDSPSCARGERNMVCSDEGEPFVPGTGIRLPDAPRSRSRYEFRQSAADGRGRRHSRGRVRLLRGARATSGVG